MDFVGWIGGKIDRMCCGGDKSFRDNPRWGSVQNEHDHILWMNLNQSTRAVGFTRKIPLCVKIVKRVLKNLLKWSEKSMTHLVALGKNTLNQNKSHFLSAVNPSTASCNRMLHFWPLSNNRCKKCRGKPLRWLGKTNSRSENSTPTGRCQAETDKFTGAKFFRCGKRFASSMPQGKLQ